MEEYNNEVSENGGSRANFLYSSAGVGYGRRSSGGSSVGNHHQFPIGTFHLQSGGSEGYQSDQPHPTVKTEANTSHHTQFFPYLQTMYPQHHQQEGSHSSNQVEAIKAKIIAHPQYSNLLEAYMNCQKVGAPPEVVARLADARQEFEARQRSSGRPRETSKDPELDQFMEAYYDMLVKYREELTRPVQEAMDFMRRIETQLNMLSNTPGRIFTEDKRESVGSSEEDEEETEMPEVDARTEDRELKNHLLRKYSGYLSSLRQELSKKKKKGKLPKDARQKLLSWWESHYKWPYPSEVEKVALAESTGLDQKQINNWFINQRKRHWKPSEDMQFMVMEGLHPQNATLYMDAHYMADAPYRLGP